MTDYNTDSVYYIMLAEAIGVANKNAAQIIYNYGSARAFIEAGRDEWRTSGLLTSRGINALSRASLEKADSILSQCKELGYSILTPEAEGYPKRLMRLNDLPLVLYVKGELPNIDDEVAIGMVGTRNASNYGCKVAHIISCGIAKAGGLVISGGAIGIDSISHNAAIMCKGKTVAVLGCGINSDYLKVNKALRETIANNGALVSEYPPDTPAGRYTFPVRNRLISGLSLGVCVVEAGARSGSLITANHALEQGRDVFVAPGSAISPAFEGTNRLLRDGAKPVFSATDIMEEYVSRYPHKINLAAIPALKTDLNDYHQNQALETINKNKYFDNKAKDSDFAAEEQKAPQVKAEIKGVSEGAKMIYEYLSFEPILFDDLLKHTGLEASVVMRSLTELELFGVVIPIGGNSYVLK